VDALQQQLRTLQERGTVLKEELFAAEKRLRGCSSLQLRLESQLRLGDVAHEKEASQWCGRVSELHQQLEAARVSHEHAMEERVRLRQLLVAAEVRRDALTASMRAEEELMTGTALDQIQLDQEIRRTACLETREHQLRQELLRARAQPSAV
jgi:hypothetical protein